MDTVLTYHVVSGAVRSGDLHDGQVISTLDAGQSVTAHVQGQNVEINNARVIRANIVCSNGIIHIVDHVLVPANFNYPKNDIPTTAESVATRKYKSVAALTPPIIQTRPNLDFWRRPPPPPIPHAVSTLVTALKTGNLVRALTYPAGPFTVFAPNDAAFGKLPAGTLAYLLAHPQELDAVLAYHVVDARGDRGRGRLYADEISNFQEVFTLNGQSLVFVVAGGKVLVNGNSTVIQANVDCSNGVVHVVDTVLIPNQRALDAKVAAWNAKNLRNKLIGLGATPNLLQLAQSVPQLSTLVTAVTAAGLGSVLSGPGPLTVFAPTNDAFARLPADFLAYLLGNKAALTKVLTYHVAAGNVSSYDLKDGQNITSVEGSILHVHKDQRGAIFIDFSQVIAPNNEASNGVAHIIDAVLLPNM